MLLKLTDDRRKVGGVALGGVWIGDSKAEKEAGCEFGGVLNVAQDLNAWNRWPNVEAMHVGLIDGPGNEPAAYCAAVLALHALLKRHNVLVCCHTGSRALAVALMYLATSNRRSWEDTLTALRERVDGLPEIKSVHRDAAELVATLDVLARIDGNFRGKP